MKFTLPPKKLKPYINDQRIVIKFAWFPKRLTNSNIVIWLERYVSVQEFSDEYQKTGEGYGYDWFEIEAKEFKQ